MNEVLKLNKYLSQFTKINFRLRIMFLLVFALALMGFIYNIYHFKPDMRNCFMDTHSNNKKLEDILLHNVKPKAGQNIFFHETSCPHNILSKLEDKEKYSQTNMNYVKLTARQACSVESAAKYNTNSNIFVLFSSPRFKLGNESGDPLIKAILSYKNVHLRNVNIWSYAANTPIYEWLKDGALFKSKYVLSHLSDFLRYVTMWRWGGTYLDMDILVQRSLEDLPPNYTGAESEHALAAGVMNFAHNGFGHEVAEACLSDLQNNFNGNDWGNNGPGVITRVMSNICQSKQIELMHNVKRCRGFHVYRQETFYAIPWSEWRAFFDPDTLQEALRRTNHSYTAHFWNNKSVKHVLDVSTKCAYILMAEKHCPRVYKVIKEHLKIF